MSPTTANQLVDFHQFAKGLAGTAAIVVAGVIWLCVSSWGIEASGLRATDPLRVVVASLLLTPPAVSSAFLIATIMMWFGRLLIRFAIGCLLLVPGYIVFCIGITFVASGPDGRLFFGAAVVLYMLVLAAATVAVAVQLSSSWVLVHSVRVRTLAQPGVGMIAELMVLASIACAVLLSVPSLREYLPATILFVGIGAIGASMAVNLQITFLRDQRARLFWLAISLMIVAVIAVFIPVCMAGLVFVDDGGVDSSWWKWSLVLITPLFAIIIGLSGLHLRWLYRCGWRCIDRRTLIPAIADVEAVDSPFDD
jgi:hypothetical protein